MNERYANVALNLSLDSLFTYRIPDHLIDSAAAGKRVLVNFGRKDQTGIIVELTNFSAHSNLKSVKSILDENPIITQELINFCKWVSEYYLNPPGKVLFSSFPRNINISSESYYFLTSDFKAKLDSAKLKNEMLIDVIGLIERKGSSGMTKKQIQKKLKLDDATRLLTTLLNAGIIYVENYYSKPTKEKLVNIAIKNFSTNDITLLIKELKIKSQKQIRAIEYLLERDEAELPDLYKKAGIGPSVISSLIAKDLIKIRQVRKLRESDDHYAEEVRQVELNDDQKAALSLIGNAIEKEEYKSFLLHGVTGSGKTEVYIKAIEKVLENGKSAIVLVPEISLTPQLIFRFKKAFGEKVGVVHSKISDGEKLDTLDRIVSGKFKIIIGARSAVFAPLRNIGIIIVDEEHDTSYKQENVPRYNGRDAAIYRARLNNAVVVLGSATPSIESYFNAQSGKHELLSLPVRAGKHSLPEIRIVDLLAKFKSDEDKKDFFDSIDKVRVRFLSKDLIFEIGERLMKKESIIILQNRRGYHSYMECLNCGNVETCTRCNISLTFHKALDLLKCHYCGFNRRYVKSCSVCKSTLIVAKGAGTERVEEELKKIFPAAVIVRMDSDTLTSRKLYNRILKDFYDKKIDILAGTQIISKGLDFPDVTLVGVVNADIGLLNPDFRATEKTFQILTQVSGRSGRSENRGEVMIQTNHADFHVFADVKNHDYKNFYNNEIRVRKLLNYPPFSRLTIVEVRSEDQKLAESKIKELFNLTKELDVKKLLEVLPPNSPLFSKLKDKYRFHLLIKSSKDKDQSGKYLNEALKGINNYSKTQIPSKVSVSIDVDAVNLL